jgi:PrcB C-terminal
VSPTPEARAVAFSEVASTSQAQDDSGPTLIIGTTDASRAKTARLVPGATAPADRVMVAAFQGQQSTGGYSIHIRAIERRGDQLVVRATLTSPGPGAIVIQVLTSPAHVVSIAAADAAGVREAILVDESGTEIARTTIT